MSEITSYTANNEIETYLEEDDETTIIAGDNIPAFSLLTHQFQQSEDFPDLNESTPFQDTGPESTGVISGDLNIAFETTATITMAHSGTNFNNTLGVYSVGEDGTIGNVEFAFTNVKNPLKLDNPIRSLENKIQKSENRIEKAQSTIEKFKQKIADTDPNHKNYDKKVANYQKQIDRQLAQIEKHEAKISEYEQDIADIQSSAGFTYDFAADHELAFFIVANGDRANKKYKDLNLENGTLEFIHDLGGAEERAAKITDSADTISLVHTLDGVVTVLKGDVYHSTERGGSNMINPDNAVHVLAGAVEGAETNTMRLGFEDRKDLGDADYNDVVFDVTIESATVANENNLDDNLAGTGTDDVIFAGEAQDVAFGYGGNDNINGGNGNDVLNGGEGDDILNGDAGDDVLRGQGGNDVISGGDGDDSVRAEDGLNIIYGDGGNDDLRGGADRDEIHGGYDNDVLYGFGGDDLLYGDGENDILFGGEGADILEGGDGNDKLRGDAGDDTMTGGAGIDDLRGYGGADTLIDAWDSDRDQLYGGADADTFVLQAGDGSNYDFIRDWNEAEGDRIDIRDVLNGIYDPLSDAISDFVITQNYGSDVLLRIDSDGAANGASFVTALRLSGQAGLVDDAETMVANGSLLVV